MTALARGLRVPYRAAEIVIRQEQNLTHVPGGGYSAASVAMYGRNGAYLAGMDMTSGALRELATMALRVADYQDAQSFARGWDADRSARPFGCLCHHDDHFADPGHYCPNQTTEPFGWCLSCWTPDEGMQYTHSDGIARRDKVPA